MIPIIIGLQINGWNLYRALRQMRVHPLVLDDDPSSVFWRCRDATLVYSERLAGPGLIADLNAATTATRQYFVLSATEPAVHTLSEFRGQLRPNINLPFPDHETVDMLLDKKKFYHRARSLGCRISAMHFFENWETISCDGEIRFPCVVKARVKRPISIPGLAKAYRVTDYDELRDVMRLLARTPGAEPEAFAVQEWVPGRDSDVIFCLQYYGATRTPLISFVGRKIRQWIPEVGGTASAAPTHNPEALQESTRFFQAVGMRGLCSMEFRRSATDGQLYMIEPTACRADYQEGVAVANGYNIPYAAYCDICSLTPYQPTPTRRPVKWVSVGDDYKAARHYVSRRELTWWRWLVSLSGPTWFAIWAPDAPQPFVEIVRRKLRNRMRRLGRMATSLWNRR